MEDSPSPSWIPLWMPFARQMHASRPEFQEAKSLLPETLDVGWGILETQGKQLGTKKKLVILLLYSYIIYEYYILYLAFKMVHENSR